MNDDFVAGWKAAREYWSAHNCSLPPYPPETPEPEDPSEGVGAPPPKHEEEDD